MSWLDDILKKLPEREVQVINDAKSPSGPPHVGSLRGVLIHDAVYKFLKEKGINVKYIYGSDDYDPLDELPREFDGKQFEKYLGQPLSEVPAPEGSDASDWAMYIINDFYDLFDELGVEAELYLMRDYYKSGFFNEAIDTVLRNADKIREIYWKVSKSERPENWYPIQVKCEKCGRIGTTEVIDYDGKEVTYVCKEDKVSWAKGCGHTGKISPFDGNAKMPYKVEWAAKWKYFGITIEGAGKDHNTKGGSHDIASAISRQVFGYEPPVNIPYGFFLLGGAKMSSSKGIGALARDMVEFLPPEILRYLMLATQPKREVNFEPNEKYITKLFNDFDKLHNRKMAGEQLQEWEETIYRLSQVFYNEPYRVLDFSLIATLIQLPHVDIFKAAEERFGSPLTELEKKVLNRRIDSARYWIEKIAPEEDLIQIQETLPEAAKDLSDAQKFFMHKLAEFMENNQYNEDTLQSAIFDVARFTPLKPQLAFQAIYKSFLNKQQGPKAGRLLAHLDKNFVINRLREQDFDHDTFVKEVGISLDEFKQWYEKNKEKVEIGEIKTCDKHSFPVVNVFYTEKGKPTLKRVLFDEGTDAKTAEDKVKEVLGL